MLKSVFRRVRKGIKDVGSFAGGEGKGIMSIALPLLLGAGILPGGKKFGLETLFGNLGTAGNFLFGNPAASYGRREQAMGEEGGASPQGFLSKIFGGGGGGGGGAIGEGIKGLFSLFMGQKAQKELEKEKAEELRKEKEARERYEVVSRKFGRPGEPEYFGGTPYVDEMIKGTVYDPKTDQTYDYYDRETDTYGHFQGDESGRIINRNQGGIAQLNVGGNRGSIPFNPNNKISGILPVQRATGGIMDEMVSEQIFDPRMSGNQMMNQIKKNPGITEFFPPKFGEIRGPGGPKDDKIPAMLSDGEFVMTAKAVDNAGGPKAMYGLMNALDPESSKGKGII